MSQPSRSASTNSSSSIFGTDGIRGEFGRPPLDEPTIRVIAANLGELLLEQSDPDRAGEHSTEASVVLGGDTRSSTDQIANWIAAELQAAGIGITAIGIAPTPAVAWAVRELNASCGIAISASHNPHRDNGLKFFDSTGYKWTNGAEQALEERLRTDSRLPTATSSKLLKVRRELTRGYIEHLERSLGLEEKPLKDLRIAIDAANGAAAPYARRIFQDLGASVDTIADTPDGENINRNCGSTHPEQIAKLTATTGANLGVSFDGDADRVVLADEYGEIHDGDSILYLWARQLASRGQLPGNRIVATSMSNIGLEQALSRSAIELVRCDVGDRTVVNTMRLEGIALGGEQSGHIIHLPSGTTGDGLASALRMALLVATLGPLSELLNDFVRFPQLIKNVVVRHKPDLDSISSIVSHQRRIEQHLGNRGRLVLRYSGTENLVRIMLEGEDAGHIGELADDLATTLSLELG